MSRCRGWICFVPCHFSTARVRSIGLTKETLSTQCFLKIWCIELAILSFLAKFSESQDCGRAHRRFYPGSRVVGSQEPPKEGTRVLVKPPSPSCVPEKYPLINTGNLRTKSLLDQPARTKLTTLVVQNPTAFHSPAIIHQKKPDQISVLHLASYKLGYSMQVLFREVV